MEENLGNDLNNLRKLLMFLAQLKKVLMEREEHWKNHMQYNADGITDKSFNLIIQKEYDKLCKYIKYLDRRDKRLEKDIERIKKEI